MNTQTEQVTENSASLAKDIFSVSSTLKLGLGLGIVYPIFILMILFGYWMDVYYGMHILFYTILACVGIFTVAVSFMLVDMFRTGKIMDAWEKRYLAYAHLVAFEFTPIDGTKEFGADAASRIVNLNPRLSKAVEGNKGSISVNVTLEGKKAKHIFDGFVETKHDLAFVKVFKDLSRPVSSAEIEGLLDEVFDAAGSRAKKRKDIAEILAISMADFSDEATAYAREQKNWIKNADGGISVNLIAVESGGYRVIWTQYGV